MTERSRCVDNADVLLTSLQHRFPFHVFNSKLYKFKKNKPNNQNSGAWCKYHLFPVSAVIRFSHKKNSYLYFLDRVKNGFVAKTTLRELKNRIFRTSTPCLSQITGWATLTKQILFRLTKPSCLKFTVVTDDSSAAICQYTLDVTAGGFVHTGATGGGGLGLRGRGVHAHCSHSPGIVYMLHLITL